MTRQVVLVAIARHLLRLSCPVILRSETTKNPSQ
jgi:hypothetical protein